MKYVSIDLETTGLDPENNQIIQVSMVIDDTSRPDIPVYELPHFTYFIQHEKYIGNAYALHLNSWILKILSDPLLRSKYPVFNKHLWISEARLWLHEKLGAGRYVAAGKNVAGFDMKFLPKEISELFYHRTLDPGPMYFDPSIDKIPPSLEECKKRANLDTEVSHDAYKDAIDVIKVLRYKWSQK